MASPLLQPGGEGHPVEFQFKSAESTEPLLPTDLRWQRNYVPYVTVLIIDLYLIALVVSEHVGFSALLLLGALPLLLLSLVPFIPRSGFTKLLNWLPFAIASLSTLVAFVVLILCDVHSMAVLICLGLWLAIAPFALAALIFNRLSARSDPNYVALADDDL